MEFDRREKMRESILSRLGDQAWLEGGEGDTNMEKH
jgi:hypothetical protein